MSAHLYHNEDMEKSVIAAILIESESIYDVITFLRPEAFYNEAHKKIFTAIYEMHRQAEKIDMLTVTEKLKKKGELDNIGGPAYITSITSTVATAQHVDYHARIVYQAYIQRQATQFGHDIFKKAQDPTIDVNDLIDEINLGSQKINELTVQESGTKTLSSLIDKSLEDAEKRQENKLKGKPMGVNTPINKLNRYTNGWQKGDLIVIAARPGMGKTAFMNACAKAGLQSGDVPLMFSLEMSATKLADRLVIGESGVDALDYRNGDLKPEDWEKIEGSVQGLYDSKILIDDKPFMTMDYIHSTSRVMIRKGAATYIMIDYLQLIKMLHKDKNMNREQEVANVSRMCKMMARELNVPVILFAQLNREVEKSAGMKRPELWHLRESGSVEQDTDIVAFMYRAEKYGILEYEDHRPSEGLGELIIAKFREGPVGTLNFRYNKSLTKIWSDEEEVSPF